MPRLRQTVRKWKPALAQLEFTQMAQYAADCAPAKTILVEHDVTLDLYQQLLAQGDDWELRRQLERWIPFETCRLASGGPRGHNVGKGSCADIGARRARRERRVPSQRRGPGTGFDPRQWLADPRRLLFIGSFAHLPNVLAVDFFLREAWPHW